MLPPTPVRLLHWNGAVWSTKLQMTIPGLALWLQGSPLLSMASAISAITTATYLESAGGTATLVTHSWNGAAWVPLNNATVPTPDGTHLLQALASGSGLYAGNGVAMRLE